MDREGGRGDSSGLGGGNELPAAGQGSKTKNLGETRIRPGEEEHGGFIVKQSSGLVIKNLNKGKGDRTEEGEARRNSAVCL